MTGSNQPPMPTPTAAQLRHAQSQFHLHHYSDGRSWSSDLINQMFHNNPSGQVDTLDPAVIRSLQQGMYQRSAPAAPAAYYLGMSDQQLYDSIHQGADPGQLGGMALAFSRSSDALIQASQNNSAAVLATSQMMWTGKSGSEARQAVATLVNQAGQAGQAAQVSAQLYAQQSIALQQAQNATPKPPATPLNATAAQQQLATITDPLQHAQLASQIQAQYAAQQQLHQELVAAVQAYDRTVTQTSQNQPGYAPPPVVAKSVKGGTGGGSVPSGTGSGAGSSGLRVPHTTTSGAGGSGVGAGNPGSGVTGVSGFGTPGAGLPGMGGQSAPAAFTGPGGSPSGDGLVPGGGFLPGGGGFGSGEDQQRSGQGPNAPSGMDAGMVGPMGGGPMGGAGADIPRSGAGFGSGGAGGAGGYGSGVPGAGSQSGAAGRGGIGSQAGAAAAEEAAMERGAAGMRGSAGAGGMMPGGRGGKGGQDEEHKRASYLVEPDADSVFGSDERTIPPVIGE